MRTRQKVVGTLGENLYVLNRGMLVLLEYPAGYAHI